ncbi:hypothetical protein AGDE_01301 [Angomonas deanei]|uniref:Uncharacterized protein n=1 Tax=Angomonas deanei TaxID=59799 RepID=A0A7G2CJ67_9TRYP|nr:hypothetical protein AGDE_01301 [Angomonas deanei]CAD2218663.1 hypothetical protein, conserved [Angomonas deanei]|eukprot:EPY42622.1 hypothetical protein AGDE_01301 [Angomonas deanei]
MGLIGSLLQRAKHKKEIFVARMQVRKIADFEFIGRLCGMLFFPFVVYVCCGSMQDYSNARITDALNKQSKEKEVSI